MYPKPPNTWTASVVTSMAAQHILASVARVLSG
jgi:hypothetical protein